MHSCVKRVVKLTTNDENNPVAEELSQEDFTRITSLFSAIPDDYDDEGIPIFHISISREEWEKTFLEHPFFLNSTRYEDAIFVVTYESLIAPAMNNWCSRCFQQQQVLQQRSTNVTRSINCPAFTIRNSGSWAADFLVGWTWEFREFCNACGFATHPWNSHWWIDWNNQHLWTWTIDCGNRDDTSSRTHVVVGGSIRRGHSPHQAASFRNPGVVHGHNCQPECGVLC